MHWTKWVGVAALALGTSLGVAQAAETPIAASRFSITIDGYEIAGVTKSESLALDGLTDAGKEKSATANKAPLALQLDANVSDAMFAWIGKSFASPGARGTLVAGDKKRSVTFRDALITEVTFPAMDARSKAKGTIRVQIVPTSLDYEKASGAQKSAAKTKAKNWLTSNFEPGGLPAGRVTKIESFTIKQKVAEAKSKEPGKLEIPNLKLTIAAADADAWKAWLASKKPRTATLALTDHTAKPWAKLQLTNVVPSALKHAGKEHQVTLGVGGVKLTR